jgi:hypothetical protein
MTTSAIPQLIARWAQIYGDRKWLSAGVTFVHLSGVLLGGGFAIVADRASLQLAPANAAELPRELARLRTVNTWVVAGLAVTFVSGLLMMLADLHTYLPSILFWTKMGLIALLIVNGAVRLRVEHALGAGSAAAWRPFRLTSAVSLVLWFCVLLAGSFLSTLS